MQGAYFAVLSLLALYGLHRLSLVATYLRRPRLGRAGQAPSAAAWPPVTVQLPIYNESCVVERLVAAACALSYPRGLLEIQILDDSTDETRDKAAGLAASYRALGHDIHHLTRPRRDGFKAGALAGGLRQARGDLIAVFDADFVPPPDFLLRCVPAFLEPSSSDLGMVQARWAHLNRDDSLLTRAQALLLDGHFVVEHGARRAAGRFLNFNGTAGVFRRACIEQAGGWQADTLTEDLDLSYRAQLAGWRFDYLAEVAVPAELPSEMNGLRSQQRRWAKGSIQTAVKLLPRILAAKLPPGVKLEAAAHLTNNAAYLLLALLAVLIVPALKGRQDDPLSYLALDLPLFALGTGSFALFCVVAQREVRRDWARGLAALPALMAIGIGLCLNNGAAVIEALSGRTSSFHRTPKRGPAGPGRARYAGPRSALVLLEGAFALWFAAAIAGAAREGRWAALPFLTLFGSGFLYITLVTARQEVERWRTARARPGEAP